MFEWFGPQFDPIFFDEDEPVLFFPRVKALRWNLLTMQLGDVPNRRSALWPWISHAASGEVTYTLTKQREEQCIPSHSPDP